jgi:hypothetical protein
MRRWWLLGMLALGACADEERPPVLPGEGPWCDAAALELAIDEVRLDDTGYTSLGHILAWLDEQGMPVQDTIDAAVVDGSIALRLSVTRCDDQFRVEMLSRSGDVQAASGLPAVGVAQPAGFSHDVDDGTGWLPLSPFVDVPGREAVWAKYADLSLFANTQWSEGRFQMSVRADDAVDALVPAATRHVNALLVGQPGCPFACEDATLAQMMRVFDVEPIDGVISEEEFRTNLFVDSWLRPTRDVIAEWEGEEVVWPDHDGIDDSTTIGFAFHATPVAMARGARRNPL